MSTDEGQIITVISRYLETAPAVSPGLRDIADTARQVAESPDFRSALARLLAEGDRKTLTAAAPDGPGEYTSQDSALTDRLADLARQKGKLWEVAHAADGGNLPVTLFLVQAVTAAALIERSSLGSKAAQRVRSQAEASDVTVALSAWRRMTGRDDPRAAGSWTPHDALLVDAVRIATSTVPPWRAQALADVADALASSDPGRAELLASSIDDEANRARALASVAAKSTDMEHVLYLLRQADTAVTAIPDDASRAAAKAQVTAKLAVIGRLWEAGPAPSAYARHALEERICDAATEAAKYQNIPGMMPSLVSLARAAAAVGPSLVQQVANLIRDPGSRAIALTEAASVARDDERLALFMAAAKAAEGIPGTRDLVSVLASAAKAAAADSAYSAALASQAEAAAWSLESPESVASALADVVAAAAVTSPDHAEAIARSIGGERQRWRALTSIVKELAAADSGRAENIARSIGDTEEQSVALASVVKELAGADPRRAENIAWSIRSMKARIPALTSIVRELAADSPGRASRIAIQATEAAMKITEQAERAAALI
ncbi:MAG: hypothetical protein ACRDN0_09070, partial [Trebonia sp.]